MDPWQWRLETEGGWGRGDDGAGAGLREDGGSCLVLAAAEWVSEWVGMWSLSPRLGSAEKYFGAAAAAAGEKTATRHICWRQKMSCYCELIVDALLSGEPPRRARLPPPDAGILPTFLTSRTIFHQARPCRRPCSLCSSPRALLLLFCSPAILSFVRYWHHQTTEFIDNKSGNSWRFPRCGQTWLEQGCGRRSALDVKGVAKLFFQATCSTSSTRFPLFSKSRGIFLKHGDLQSTHRPILGSVTQLSSSKCQESPECHPMGWT